MSARSATEVFILKYIGKLLPGGANVKIYKDFFAKMSDKEFDTFIGDLESGKKFLPVVVPNFGAEGMSTENNLALAEELGHEFFQKLWIEGNDDLPTYLTPIEYLVIDLPVRRASQLLTKKISVPDDNKTIDALTGQPTGESKGAKLSYPELQVCAAMNQDNSMLEMMKYRGGDSRGNAAYTAMLSKQGKVNLSVLSQFSSGVESTRTLKTFLTCMHLRTTL
jgi:hypothetical protein